MFCMATSICPSIRPSSVSDPPRILVRNLKGGGVHDDNELIEIPLETFDGLMVSMQMKTNMKEMRAT